MIKIFTDSELFKLVYGDGGYPNDDTISDRIKFFTYNDLHRNDFYGHIWIVKFFRNKIIGIIRLFKDQYKYSVYPGYKSGEIYTVSYFSIDPKHQGKGYATDMARVMFSYVKENSIPLRMTGYTTIGYKVLKPLLKRLCPDGVDFVDDKEIEYPDYEKTSSVFGRLAQSG